MGINDVEGAVYQFMAASGRRFCNNDIVTNRCLLP
jgi:hypothetical protein